jgi:hypothetical protein
MNPSLGYHYLSFIRNVSGSFVLCVCLFALTACDGNGIVNHQVNGTLAIQNVDCDLVIPAQVKVHAEVFQGNRFVGVSGAFGANGLFNLTIQWPQNWGQPDGWRVSAVTRLDDTEVCTRDTCGGQRQCLDMATNVRQALLTNTIDRRIDCKCVGG